MKQVGAIAVKDMADVFVGRLRGVKRHVLAGILGYPSAAIMSRKRFGQYGFAGGFRAYNRNGNHASAVFGLRAITEQREIRIESRGGDAAVFQGRYNSATRLAAMRTIAESAVGRQAENLSKIMPHLFFLKIKCAKSLNAGGIDNGTIGGLRKEIHLGESGGMHALVVGI